METIKSYLEAMFANLPNTPEVKKAKAELLNMMEDKYNELLDDGVSENEAVGTVISEFGNLDELADTLGLTKEVQETKEREESRPRHFLRIEEIENYLSVAKTNALFISVGVLLCITSVIWPIASDEIFHTNESFGVSGMFISIAVAVALFIYAGIRGNDWEFLDKELCQIDMATADMVKEKKKAFKVPNALLICIGVMLFILWIPVTCVTHDFMSGVALFLFFVGIGVLLCIYANMVMGSYEKVLKLNDSKTISGSYGKDEGDIVYINKFAEGVMEVFWPTMTCIYLMVSFVTMDWHITWVIWPVAAIVHRVLEIALAAEEE